MTDDARTILIDRVARVMTAGAPGADFADRVMAPIDGRPRRGFVARVMAGLDAAPLPQPRRRSARVYAPALAAAAIGIAALAVLWRPDHLTWPAANAPGPRVPSALGAPRFAMATAPPDAGARPSPEPPARPRATVTSARMSPRIAPAIGSVAPLADLDPITIPTIEPAPVTVPALAAPAPLTTVSLKGQKEKR